MNDDRCSQTAGLALRERGVADESKPPLRISARLFFSNRHVGARPDAGRVLESASSSSATSSLDAPIGRASAACGNGQTQ